MSGPWSLWQLSALVLNMTPAINPSQESISRKKKKPYIKLIPGSSDVKIKKKILFILLSWWFVKRCDFSDFIFQQQGIFIGLLPDLF